MIIGYVILQAVFFLFFLVWFLRRGQGPLPFVRLPRRRFWPGFALSLLSAVLLGAALGEEMWLSLCFLPPFQAMGALMMVMQLRFAVEPGERTFFVTSITGKRREFTYSDISRIRFEKDTVTLFLPGERVVMDSRAINGVEFIRLAQARGEDALNREGNHEA